MRVRACVRARVCVCGATGMHGATDMFDNESAEARQTCYYARALMLLAGVCASFLFQSEVPFAPRALLSVGCAQLLVGAVWCAVWGAGDLVRTTLRLCVWLRCSGRFLSDVLPTYCSGGSSDGRGWSPSGGLGSLWRG